MDDKSSVERYLALIIAVVGVIGGMVGGFASHYWTRNLMLEEQALEMRKKAYLDFFNGQSLILRGDEKVEEGNQLIRSAKLTMLLVGSHDIICSMARYWASAQKYPGCHDVELRKKDASIYQGMRRESFESLKIKGSPDLEAAVIVPYLWNCIMPGEDLEQLCRNP